MVKEDKKDYREHAFMRNELEKGYSKARDIYFLDVAGVWNLSKELEEWKGQFIRNFLDMMAANSDKEINDIIKKFKLYKSVDKMLLKRDSLKERVYSEEFIKAEDLKLKTYDSTTPAVNCIMSNFDRDSFIYSCIDLADYSALVLKKERRDIGLSHWVQDGLKAVIWPVIEYIKYNTLVDQANKTTAVDVEEKIFLLGYMRMKETDYSMQELKFARSGLEFVATSLTVDIQGRKIVERVLKLLK